MSSNLSDKSTREWVQLYKKLYMMSKEQVYQKLGQAHTHLIPLEKKYSSELKKKWKVVTKEAFLEEFLGHQFIMLGDFHALQQSQRGHLRILRDLAEKLIGTPQKIVLAVEFFQAKHQPFIQKYLNEKISEKTFLEKINWDKTWGFPWQNYVPLMDWVKSQKIPIYGINWGLKETKLSSLKLRDNYSALELKKISKKHPDAIIIVIYGELHLLQDQLPNSLKRVLSLRNLDLIRVFQNFEPFYFELAQKGLENQVEYLKVGQHDYCVMNVPPWVKWQSYLMYLEQNLERDLDDIGVDFTDHLMKQVQFLMLSLKVNVPLGGLSVYTVGDESFFKKLQNLSVKESAKIKKLIHFERSFYIPQMQMGYLARMDINHMASLSAEYLHSVLCDRHEMYLKNANDFIPMIWIQTLKYFGSKLINHKRKTNSIEDIRKTLLMNHSLRSKKNDKREALLLVLQQKVREVSMISTGRKPQFKSKTKDPLIYWEAARLIGGMLGERLFIAFRKGTLKESYLKQLFNQKMDDPNFESFYYEQVKKVEKLRHKN